MRLGCADAAHRGDGGGGITGVHPGITTPDKKTTQFRV
jgi:hypothetical protein